MINAGLLVLLFLAAMTMRDDVSPSTGNNFAADREITAQQPLFVESLEIASSATMPSRQVVEVSVPPAPTPIAAAAEPITHKLPPLVVEPAPSKPPLAVNTPTVPLRPPTPIEISVEKGDSLEKIAKKYHTSVDEIIKLNQLPTSFLKVGQRLKISAETSDKIALKGKKTPSSTQTGADYYTMKVGDNPWSIAMKHHLKVDELLKLNGLNEQTARKLKPGDRLRIR